MPSTSTTELIKASFTCFHLASQRTPATALSRPRIGQPYAPNSVAQTMPVVALFVGSGYRIKGLDRALRAIAANRTAAKDLEFWIVGNGKQNRFASLAKQAGVTVRFLGGRADVDRFYDAADFLLHPAYSESAGKVLLEALTHGLPVLTTDTCGYAPHILKARRGSRHRKSVLARYAQPNRQRIHPKCRQQTGYARKRAGLCCRGGFIQLPSSRRRNH